ncbi:MAG: efflux RND transporter periplasmic adaptor subunit [Ferribacterium limneticum]
MTRLLRSRRSLLVIAGIAIVALLVTGYTGWGGERVVVAVAERGELRQAVVASGRVRTPQRIEVAAQISARVVAVKVREGDAVTTGQTMIQLDDTEWRASAAQARASLAQAEAKQRQLDRLGRPVAEQSVQQAEANAQQAKRHFERVGELVAKGFYSTAQLDDARRNAQVADSQWQAAKLQLVSNQPGGSEAQVVRSNVEQARAALAVAEARLAYGTLTAASAGRVLTRSVEAGDMVQPGKVLLTVAPQGDTELTAQIDEKNLALLQLGQTAQASADAYPGEHFTAEVTYIAPAVDAQRGSVEIRLRVAEPPAYLKHEMTVSIDIASAHRADTLIVPADVIRDQASGQPWVMVVRDGVAQRQPVKLGIRGAGRVEILDGIVAGEALAAASQILAEGRKVSTVNRK